MVGVVRWRILFYHACQDKPSLDGYAFPAHLPNPGCYEGHLEDLRRLWSGRLWVNDTPSPSDASVIARLRGTTFDYERVGLGTRPIRFLEDDRVGRGAARCEFGWSIIDGTLAVTDCDGRPTFTAREGPGGVWRGRWLEYERCEVVLTPVAGHPQAAARGG